MPGPPRRLWISFGLACRSLLLDSVGKLDDALLTGSSRGAEALGRAFSLHSQRVVVVDGPSSPLGAVKFALSGMSPSSSRAERRPTGWDSKIVGRLRVLSCSNFELPGGGFSCRTPTASKIKDSLLQSRHFAASARLATKRPRRIQKEGKINARGKVPSKSTRRGVVARKSRPQFRGPLASIRGLSSEVDGRKPRQRWCRGAASKRQFTPPNLSLRRRGPAIGLTNKTDEENLTDGTLKRRRKRIKPNPKDITYKRAADSDIKSAAILSNRTPAAEQTSLNAQFRQIQPSAELLAHIERNFLGRRRLIEWRRGGYDPKRTAPLDDLPDGKTKRNPIQETVFKNRLVFVAAAKQAPSIPTLDYPEIAFAGRSNVGKSSLINALTRRWGAARTSEKPGLTQSINFFTLGSRLCLVDLPGYGFAYAKEQKQDAWEELVKHYVQSRANLKRVCMLVDAKWGLKPRDEEMIHLMESSGTMYQIVITKTDVLCPLDLARRATQILQVLENNRYFVQPLVMVSSKSGAGLQLFRSSLASIATRRP